MEINGTNYTVRGLTRRQLKELGPKADFVAIARLDDDGAAEALQEVFAVAVTPAPTADELFDWTPAEIMGLALEVQEATYLPATARKNLNAQHWQPLPGAAPAVPNAPKS